MTANKGYLAYTKNDIERNFRVVKSLTEGAYGNTVLMSDINQNFIVRKRFDISLLSEFERKLCLNEIKIISNVNHPFIVKYICSYIDRKYLCIVTEYCKGGDLHKYIAYRKRMNQPIKEERILIWLTQILSAIKFLHKRHTLHRDSNKNVKICDFGVSKSLNKTTDNTSTLIGTPYYFSPELVNGQKYGFPSDIWALGCILYELCTFKTPFHGAKGILELTKLINENKVPDLPNTYSYELNTLYKSMMFRDVRYRLTASELISTELVQGVLKKMLKDARNKKLVSEEEPFYNTDTYISDTSGNIPIIVHNDRKLLKTGGEVHV